MWVCANLSVKQLDWLAFARSCDSHMHPSKFANCDSPFMTSTLFRDWRPISTLNPWAWCYRFRKPYASVESIMASFCEKSSGIIFRSVVPVICLFLSPNPSLTNAAARLGVAAPSPNWPFEGKRVCYRFTVLFRCPNPVKELMPLINHWEARAAFQKNRLVSSVDGSGTASIPCQKFP